MKTLIILFSNRGVRELFENLFETLVKSKSFLGCLIRNNINSVAEIVFSYNKKEGNWSCNVNE